MGIEVERLEYAVVQTGFEKLERDFQKVEKIVESTAKGASQKFRIDYNSEEFKKRTEEFKKGFQTITDKSAETAKATEKNVSTFSRVDAAVGSFAGNIAGNLFTVILDKTVEATQALIKYNLELENTQQKYTQITGSASKAYETVKQIQDFSIKYGQDKSWVNSAAMDFERLQINASGSLGIIEAIGNQIASVGGDDKMRQSATATMENVIRSQRLTLEAVNQFESAGISQQRIFEMLRGETGKTNEQLAILLKNGKITSDVFVKSFVQMSQTKFGDSMKKEAETASNSLWTLWEAITAVAAARVGDAANSSGITKLIKDAASLARDEAADSLFEKTPDETAKQPKQNPFRAEEFLRQLEIRKTQLHQFYDDRFNLISNNEKIQEAQLNSFLRLTSQDELNYQKKRKEMHKYYLDVQVSAQKQFFDKQIALAGSDAQEVARLTTEKNKTLRNLNTELQVSELNSAKQIAETEQRILEQRRQSAIQFKQFQIRELSQVIDSNAFNFNRSISFGIDLEGNFARLKNLTQSSYQEIVRITVESYDIQLQNEKLSWEERVNLNRQKYLDLQSLAELNRQKQIQISDNQYREQINLLEKYNQQTRNLWQSHSEVFESFTAFFNPQSFAKQNSFALTDVILGGSPEFVNQYLKKVDSLKQKIKDLQDIQKWNAGLMVSTTKIDEELQKTTNTLNKLTQGYSGSEIELVKLIRAMNEGTIGIEAFDKANRKILESQHLLQKQSLESEIAHIGDLITNETNRLRREFEANPINKDKVFDIKTETSNTLKDLTYRLQLLNDQKKQLSFKQASESLDLYKKSVEGLKETLKNIRIGDTTTMLGLQEVFEKQRLESETSNAINSKNLDFQISNFWKDSETRQDNATKEYRLSLLQKEENALTKIKISQEELANKWKVSNNQIRASILEVLASQKSLTDIITEASTGALESAFSTIDSSIHALAESLGIADTAAGRFFETILAGLAKLAINKLFQWLLGGQGANSVGGGGGGTGLSWWKRLLISIPQLIRGIFGGGFDGFFQTLFGGGGSIGNLVDSPIGGGSSSGLSFAAEGGSFSSGEPVIVGERGWELFIPKTSGTVYNQRQLKSMSYAPNYSFPKNYSADVQASRNAANGGGAVYHQEIHNHFHANKQTGAFSKPSAEQTANQLSQTQQYAFKRSNKTT